MKYPKKMQVFIQFYLVFLTIIGNFALKVFLIF